MHLIESIFSVLAGLLSNPQLEVLSQISRSILTSSGKITMLEISRHTGYCYRSVCRFFTLPSIPWETLNITLFKHFIYSKDDVILAAADETIEPKSGKFTHGAGVFFSNLVKKAIKSVAFMSMSLVSVKRHKSFPVAMTQIIKGKKPVKSAEQQTPKPDLPKRKPGRPKGSKNKPKETSKDPQYEGLEKLLIKLTKLFNTYWETTPCAYLLLDGYFGNKNYIRLSAQYGLELISKLKQTSALFFPYSGLYSGSGRPRKYGDKMHWKKIPEQYCFKTEQEQDTCYKYYQMHLWSNSYTDALLNVVVIIATNRTTGKQAKVILFSSDLKLGGDKIVQYYRLRFQIEFNFRDAKQFFGLSDFKNYKEIQMTNAVNLAFFLCNFTYILIENFKEHFDLKTVSILDVKAFFRTQNIADRAMELNTKNGKAVKYLNQEQILNLAKSEAINL